MRVRWRGLELPGRVVREDSVSTGSFGRFIIEPFEQGFGTTIGNSLRRALLSSLEGAAITTLKIAGVAHEFASIDGVLEDVTDIVLNVKGVVVEYEGETGTTMTVQRNTAGEVRAGDIVTEPSVMIANPDHVIATLTANVPFHAEFTVRTGRGFATASDNRSAEQELGVIPIDSVFSPVLRVRYRTEDMRVGQLTNYDRLILEVWTNGTVAPEDALVEAGLILRKHLNPFVLYHEMGDDVVSAMPYIAEHATPVDSALDELLSRPVSSLNLSVRASNCLEAARVDNIRELVTRSEADLLRFRSFGKTSLHEVQRKLSDVGLTLGMRFGEEGAGSDAGSASAVMGGSASALGGRHVDSPGSLGGGGAAGNPQSGPMAAYTMGD